MVNVHIVNIYNDIKEISDIDYQRRAWCNNSKYECSSYIEIMCRLFDDDNFDMFIDNNAKDYGFDSSFIVLLNQLRNMLNNYIGKNSDIEIITDPKWIKIALHAKKIICLWDKKYGSR